MRIRVWLCVLLASASFAATPWVDRVSPLGGQTGTVITLELSGKDLAGAAGVQFDAPSLHWLETLESTATMLRGKVRIAPEAAPGSHFIRIQGKAGPSNTRLFNVMQFPGVAEMEPNDTPATAQALLLHPQVVYGAMNEGKDVDLFSFAARAGERWLFDLQSIERGGFLEASLTLSDEAGKECAFNEDRDEYLETPRLEVTFPRTGRYTLRVDQYRGPQGVDCGKNCGYSLQISQLPVILAANPVGGRVGATLRMDLSGHSLQAVREVYLTPVRGAQYERLTFPFTIPIRFQDDAAIPGPSRISGRILQPPGKERLQAEFSIPADASPGLWRLWTIGPEGRADGIHFEISPAGLSGETIHDGTLEKPGEEDFYPVALTAGVPFHAWTAATQLGLPFIDTVLELFDEDGKLLAEHDDLMTGQGTVIGNPDSSLYFLPKATGKARLIVRDRTGRGGPTYVYRLHVDSRAPSFQLLTEPEEFTVASGGEAEWEILLIREPGFEQAVDVWVEGLPEGATATRGQFRADQVFGPSGDGDNINIPLAKLRVRVPKSVAPGDYPVRVRGRAASGGATVEGFTTLWIGPAGKRNDTRRPLPRIVLHVAP